MGDLPAEWGMPAIPGSVPRLRRELLEAITGRGFDEDAVALAATEVLTNAVRHAYPGSQGPVTLSVKQTADRLVVVVADEGIGARSFTARSGADRGAGMGLPLLHELCASIRVDPGNSGTTVTMAFARALTTEPPPGTSSD
jgi:anti-sigma regulatory factor (Ser/Thr protein kinase)